MSTVGRSHLFLPQIGHLRNRGLTKSVRVRLFVLAISCVVSGAANAQNAGPTFGGTVLDDRGNVVPEAFVVLFQGGNLTRTVQADGNGKFQVIGYVAGGNAVIGAQRIGYRGSQASRRELESPDLAIELRLDRETSSRGKEKVLAYFGGLAKSSEIVATAIAGNDAASVHWKLERNAGSRWTSVVENDAAPRKLFHYQFIAADVKDSLHASFRLTAIINYSVGNEEASHAFVVSKESRLIDGEP